MCSTCYAPSHRMYNHYDSFGPLCKKVSFFLFFTFFFHVFFILVFVFHFLMAVLIHDEVFFYFHFFNLISISNFVFVFSSFFSVYSFFIFTYFICIFIYLIFHYGSYGPICFRWPETKSFIVAPR